MKIDTNTTSKNKNGFDFQIIWSIAEISISIVEFE